MSTAGSSGLQSTSHRRHVWWLVGALLVLPGFFVLDDFGVTWDEALGDFFFGQRYLSYFSSFDERYLDFAADPYETGMRPDLRTSPFRDRPWEYYPLANTLGALTSKILSSALGLFDSFDGFHAVNLILALAFVPLFARFVASELGAAAALVAVLVLFLQPRIVVHGLANIKDFPEMIFFAASCVAAHWAWTRGSWRRLVVAGGVWGLALATKANALFVPFVVLGMVLLSWAPDVWRGEGGRIRWRPLLGGSLAGGFVGLGAMVALWPYLWPDPIGNFVRHLTYVSGQVFQVRSESLTSPLGAVLLTTPPLVLLLFVAGLPALARQLRRRSAFATLIVSWIVVVLGRLYLPGAVNFDGVRHFLELFPALAVVAAWGARDVGRLVVAYLDRRMTIPRWTPHAGVALLTVVLLWPVLATHPHQIAYWNWLGGGLSGARERGEGQAGDYWGVSYRQGIEWLNENAEERAIVAVPLVEHAVTLVAPERLRGDLGLAHVSVPVMPDIPPQVLGQLRATAREHPVYVMFVLRRDWMNALMRDCIERLEPVAEWSLAGEPLLQIYRYDVE